MSADSASPAFVLLCLVPTIAAYLYAAHRASIVRHMLEHWPRLPGVIIASHEHLTRKNRTVYAPTVEWSPEGEAVFTMLPDRRADPWPVGEHVTLLRDPDDWQRSRLLDASGLYWQEVWPLVITGSLGPVVLLAWSLL
jgi:hypothetical protein